LASDKRNARTTNLAEFFSTSPLVGAESEIARSQDAPREAAA
jgi:hypothetical protein